MSECLVFIHLVRSPGSNSGPGWDRRTIGVHSDDGQLFVEGKGNPGLVPPFNKEGEVLNFCLMTIGTVVGLGICPRSKRAFLTLDGNFVSFLAKLSPSAAPLMFPAFGCSDRQKKGWLSLLPSSNTLQDPLSRLILALTSYFLGTLSQRIPWMMFKIGNDFEWHQLTSVKTNYLGRI